ncbi:MULTISPECIES: hypothetical protein [Pseudomonas]|uniref:hypothetical protein n=1 Tax=Pseudomonas TaxID=286 RepID=UPI001D1105B9|nr:MULTISPECIES: hypothetical protein [Pseudomonas]
MSIKRFNKIAFNVVFAFVMSVCSGLVVASSKDSVDARSEGEGCYGFLTELVRSSDFPFRYTTKDKVNLLIDDDDGERVQAQLFYKTSGEGIIGWITYYVKDESLFNESADLEEPVKLAYDKKYSRLYGDCVAKLKK